MTPSQNEKYMQMALKLAKKGIGSVEPNPPVGCVIVKSQELIGKGFHEKFGDAHAEINAIGNCTKNPAGATMYVTLEPCCHEGKTGPCTKAIIEAQISKVFIAANDPSQHANGKGIEQLHNAGIEIQTGICQNQAQQLIAPFIKYATTKKPWVILKWAQSIDGKLAWKQTDDDHRWISNESSRKDVHKLRRRVQAILVGVNTIIADDPLLTPRPDKDSHIAAIVLDTKLRIPTDCKLLKTTNRLVFIATGEDSAQTEKAKTITNKGAKLLYVPLTNGRCDLNALLDQLGRLGIAQLLVEGGPTVLTEFLNSNLADEVIIYIAPKPLGNKGTAQATNQMQHFTSSTGCDNIEKNQFNGDIRLIARLNI